MSTTTTHERSKKQIEIDEAVLERVKRGLAWLEETHGPGWEDHIDLGKLNLSSGSSCVLGQVFDWNDGDILGFDWAIIEYELEDEGASLGFCINSDEVEWDQLQKAWEYVLTPLVGRPA